PKYNKILSNKCKNLTKLNQLDINNAPNLLYVMDDFYKWFCKFNHRFDCEYVLAGGCAIDETGEPLPNKTVETCRKNEAVLL
ncbi:isocitrate/isopropylmalate family dehydrogenase, partial [Clostridioides difficile]|uniref:isocitrate/isopropylmalate family dehydrogenase n=1 Tax=Clostridioides difficile TaxID=1496 RepID=UPI002ED2E6AC